MFVPREINFDDLSQIPRVGPMTSTRAATPQRAGPRANLPAMRASSVLPSLTKGRARVSTPGIPRRAPRGSHPSSSMQRDDVSRARQGAHAMADALGARVTTPSPRAVVDTSSSRRRRSRGPAAPAASKDDLLVDLVRALTDAGSKKIAKDFDELVVEPFAEADPKPLPGLVPPAELADPDSRFVTVDVRGQSVTVHYKEIRGRSPSDPSASSSSSPASAPPEDFALVCLHGANGSEFSFRNLLPRVARETGARCVAFDRPPYGLSSRPRAPKDEGEGAVNFAYTPEGQAELTLAVMDALGVRRAALLGHSAGAPVALDAALIAPERCARLIMVAPAVFVGPSPAPEDDDGDGDGDGTARRRPSGGVPRLPLDRALRFAWFRFLVSRDAPGLNVVRGSVNRQMAAIDEGRAYADLSPEARAAYQRPTKAEGWDQGLLQLFRAGGFGGDGERLRREMPRLVEAGTRASIVIGANDRTTPPSLAEGLRDAMRDAGLEPEYALVPAAGHLPMEEESEGVRKTFENIVVSVVREETKTL